MSIVSEKARKQRKYLFNAPLHKKRKWIASHLEESLLLKYDRRSVPVIKGDTVKVMRGNFKGHEDKVSRVHVGKQRVEVEGLTLVKADGKKIARPLHPSKLLITKLNLTDSWRRSILERGLSEDAKKDIEREAKEQLRMQAEAQKKAEEEARRKEAEERIAEEKAAEETKEAASEKTEAASQTESKVDEKQPLAPNEKKIKDEKIAEEKPVEKPSKKEPGNKSSAKKKKTEDEP